jgi:hypothetical protein
LRFSFNALQNKGWSIFILHILNGIIIKNNENELKIY